MLKVNDLFCGCGGIGLGFKEAGFETAGAWDYDKYAVQSYIANVDSIAKQADITQMTYEDMPKADVWTFGFPCQDLSIAGKQAGLFEGKRSGLFFEVMRLLAETRENNANDLPRIILAENVKGLKPYIEVLKEEYQKQGYKFYIQLYNSKYWGVPQNRERYFVVGVREDIAKEFVYPVQQTEFVPKLSSILEQRVDEKYYIDDEKAQKIIEQSMLKLERLGSVHATLTPDRLEKRQNGRRAKEEEEMFTLTRQDIHGIIIDDTYGYDGVRVYTENSPALRSSRQGLKTAECTEPHLKQIGMLEMKGNECIRRVYDAEGIAPTATTCEGGHRQIKILDKYRYRIRKLTATEYGFLQGFPMATWEQVVSNSQAYKQFGNAVTVSVAKAMATAIKEFLE